MLVGRQVEGRRLGGATLRPGPYIRYRRNVGIGKTVRDRVFSC